MVKSISFISRLVNSNTLLTVVIKVNYAVRRAKRPIGQHSVLHSLLFFVFFLQIYVVYAHILVF